MTDTHKRLLALDTLRGLAIIGVIAVHTVQEVSTGIATLNALLYLGRFGVQLFFLVSALTMCHMWLQRETEDAKVRRFYWRRCMRIAPLFWAAIPLYLLVNGMQPQYWAPDGISLRDVALTATFLHGFWPSAINSVVPGGWSIAVEMTFYLFFPILIIAFGNRRIIYLVIALVVWTAYNFVLRDGISTVVIPKLEGAENLTLFDNFLYLNFLNQCHVFLLGIYLFFLRSQRFSWIDGGVFLIWFGLAAYAAVLGLEGAAFFAVCFALLGLCYLVLRFDIHVAFIASLGRNSYSIYLLHFMVIKFLSEMVSFGTGLIAWLVFFVAITAITYALSILTYRYIEKPLSRFSSKTAALIK